MEIKAKPTRLRNASEAVVPENRVPEAKTSESTGGEGPVAHTPLSAADVQALAFAQIGRSITTRIKDVAGVKNAPKLDVANDYRHDGALVGAGEATFSPDTPLDQVPVVTPNNGKEANGTIIHINGMLTDVKLHVADMQKLANTGVNVVGVHNATRGFFKDLAQSVGDKMEVAIVKNTAVTTTADLLYDSLKKGEPVSLVGHSQGCLVISNALKQARTRLMVEDGLTRKEATEKLGTVKVETLGGAAARYCDGPEFIHHVNKFDVVPMLTGVGMNAINPFGKPGAGAVVHIHKEAGDLADPSGVTKGFSAYLSRAVDRMVTAPHNMYFKHRAGY